MKSRELGDRSLVTDTDRTDALKNLQVLNLVARAFGFGHRPCQIEEASHAVGQAAAIDGDRAHLAGFNQYFCVGD